MRKTANCIKTYVIITVKALLTFILGLLIVIGSIVKLILQLITWPFAFVANNCMRATKRLHLVEDKPAT